MKVFIRGIDRFYDGAYGMEEMGVFEVESEDEAIEIGHELSTNVIESYNQIQDSIEDEASRRAAEEGLSYEEAYENAYNDDVAFIYIWLKDDAPNSIITDDWKQFISTWGRRE